MADVVLCYASEDAAVAGRLAAAVAGLGYTLWSEKDLEGSRGDITDRISLARAAIVIWSEAAAASDWVRAEANFARGQKKLIQVSADDRPPPLPFRPAEVASIADWQGGDAHPGWRRINAALEALCGPAAGKTAALGPSGAKLLPSPAAGPARRGRSPGLVAGLTLALLAVVALATYLWTRDLAPAHRDPRPSIAASAPPVRPAPDVEPEVAAPAVAVPLDEASSTQPPTRGADRPPGRTEAPPPRSTIETPPKQSTAQPPPPRSTVEAAPPPGKAAASPPAPATPRISREYSQNMRLFCRRAGRGTPQCRTFARQLRDARR